MNEVSCRVFGVPLDAMSKREIPHDRLAAGFPVQLATLRDPHQRIDWDLFSRLCERIEELLGGRRQLELVAYQQFGTPSYAYMRGVASILLMPKDLYWLGTFWFGRNLFTIMEDDFQELPDGRIRERLRIPERYRPCPQIFHFIKGSLQAAPSLIGLGDARIDAEISEREATFVITPPESRFNLGRWGRSMLARSRSKALVNELTVQQAELQHANLELTRTVEALRQSEERHRVLSELGSDYCYSGRVTTDGSFQLLWVTGAFERTTGYKAASLGVGHWEEFVHPDDRSLVEERFRRAIKDGVSREEYRIRTRSGDTRWILESMRALQDEESGEVLVVGAAQDVTMRRRAQDAQMRLTAAVDQSEEAMMVFDRKGHLLYANPAAGVMLHRAPERLVGTPVDRLARDPETLREVRAALRTGEIWKGRMRSDSEGQLDSVHYMTVAPVRDLHGEVQSYVSIVRDVTRETRLEEELIQGQRLEAVGRLAGGVAHDFNNLLTVIAGYSEMLQARLSEDKGSIRALEQIQEASERGSQLIHRLLAFSRDQTLNPEPVDLNGVIQDVDAVLRRIIGEHIDLESDLDPGVGLVSADPLQLEQMLFNLALNARDAMPEGGRLRFRTRLTELDASQADELGLESGGFAALTVSDTGFGMDVPTQSRIFEPFFTTKEVGKGTGLGLSTAFGVVKQGGGTITVESAPGRGSTFTVLLPLAAEVATAKEQPLIRAGKSLRAGTLLLVEDDETVRSLARTLLLESDFDVIDAPDGEQALALARRHAGRIDLLLTDVVMPKLGGPALYELLRETRPELHVLYMSGYPDLSPHGAVSPAQAHSTLAKPFTPSELVDSVRAALNPN